VLTFLIRIDNRTVGVDHSIHIKGRDILNCKIECTVNHNQENGKIVVSVTLWK